MFGYLKKYSFGFPDIPLLATPDAASFGYPDIKYSWLPHIALICLPDIACIRGARYFLWSSSSFGFNNLTNSFNSLVVTDSFPRDSTIAMRFSTAFSLICFSLFSVNRMAPITPSLQHCIKLWVLPQHTCLELFYNSN